VSSHHVNTEVSHDGKESQVDQDPEKRHCCGAVTDSKANKSAAIREYVARNANAKPMKIVAAPADEGITVSPTMAS
jgi:hypothetical protein